MYNGHAADILDALNSALLSDDELRVPQDWIHYDYPFGDWHEDPCADPADDAEDTTAHHTQDGDRS